MVAMVVGSLADSYSEQALQRSCTDKGETAWKTS